MSFFSPQLTRLTSALTALFFVMSTVSPAASAAVAAAGEGARLKPGAESPFIPSSLGRVSGGAGTGTGRLVVAVQDLHCHPEVQRNITSILESLSSRYEISRIFLEGASGTVDLSWYDTLTEPPLRDAFIESLMAQGKLSGATYFALKHRDYADRLYGLENRELHAANLVRFSRILDRQAETAKQLAAVRRTLEAVKREYLSLRHRRLDVVAGEYRAGRMTAEKYLALLANLARNAGIDIEGYTNIAAYRRLRELEQGVDYRLAGRDLERLMVVLRERLTYSEYRRIAEKAADKNAPDDLLGLVAEAANRTFGAVLSRRGALQPPANDAPVQKQSYALSGTYPHLARLIESRSLNRELDPLAMVGEEKRLVRDLRNRLSESKAEREVGFLSDYFRCLEDCLNAKLTAEDYQWFTRQYDRFVYQWITYAGDESYKEFEPQLQELRAFYDTNIERNREFLKAIAGSGEYRTAAGTSSAVSPQPQTIDIVVMGGFHTEGMARLFGENNIPHITITPPVTQSAVLSDRAYRRLVEEEVRLLSQTINLPEFIQSDPLIQAMAVTSFMSQVLLNEKCTSSEVLRRLKPLLDTIGKRHDIDVTVQDIREKDTLRFVLTAGKNIRSITYVFDDTSDRWLPEENNIAAKQQLSPEKRGSFQSLLEILHDMYARGTGSPIHGDGDAHGVSMLVHNAAQLAYFLTGDPRMLKAAVNTISGVIHDAFKHETMPLDTKPYAEERAVIARAAYSVMGFGVDVEICTDDRLTANEDFWGLAFMEYDRARGRYVIYVHEDFLKGLEGLEKDVAVTILKALGMHEPHEYNSVVWRKGKLFNQFKTYLTETRGQTSKVLYSREEFHAFLENMGPELMEKLRDDKIDVGDQKALFDYARRMMAEKKMEYSLKPILPAAAELIHKELVRMFILKGVEPGIASQAVENLMRMRLGSLRRMYDNGVLSKEQLTILISMIREFDTPEVEPSEAKRKADKAGLFTCGIDGSLGPILIDYGSEKQAEQRRIMLKSLLPRSYYSRLIRATGFSWAMIREHDDFNMWLPAAGDTVIRILELYPRAGKEAAREVVKRFGIERSEQLMRNPKALRSEVRDSFASYNWIIDAFEEPAGNPSPAGSARVPIARRAAAQGTAAQKAGEIERTETALRARSRARQDALKKELKAFTSQFGKAARYLSREREKNEQFVKQVREDEEQEKIMAFTADLAGMADYLSDEREKEAKRKKREAEARERARQAALEKEIKAFPGQFADVADYLSRGKEEKERQIRQEREAQERHSRDKIATIGSEDIPESPPLVNEADGEKNHTLQNALDRASFAAQGIGQTALAARIEQGKKIRGPKYDGPQIIYLFKKYFDIELDEAGLVVLENLPDGVPRPGALLYDPERNKAVIVISRELIERYVNTSDPRFDKERLNIFISYIALRFFSVYQPDSPHGVSFTAYLRGAEGVSSIAPGMKKQEVFCRYFFSLREKKNYGSAKKESIEKDLSIWVARSIRKTEMEKLLMFLIGEKDDADDRDGRKVPEKPLSGQKTKQEDPIIDALNSAVQEEFEQALPANNGMRYTVAVDPQLLAKLREYQEKGKGDLDDVIFSLAFYLRFQYEAIHRAAPTFAGKRLTANIQPTLKDKDKEDLRKLREALLDVKTRQRNFEPYCRQLMDISINGDDDNDELLLKGSIRILADSIGYPWELGLEVVFTPPEPVKQKAVSRQMERLKQILRKEKDDILYGGMDDYGFDFVALGAPSPAFFRCAARILKQSTDTRALVECLEKSSISQALKLARLFQAGRKVEGGYEEEIGIIRNADPLKRNIGIWENKWLINQGGWVMATVEPEDGSLLVNKVFLDAARGRTLYREFLPDMPYEEARIHLLSLVPVHETDEQDALSNQASEIYHLFGAYLDGRPRNSGMFHEYIFSLEEKMEGELRGIEKRLVRQAALIRFAEQAVTDEDIRRHKELEERNKRLYRAVVGDKDNSFIASGSEATSRKAALFGLLNRLTAGVPKAVITGDNMEKCTERFLRHIEADEWYVFCDGGGMGFRPGEFNAPFFDNPLADEKRLEEIVGGFFAKKGISWERNVKRCEFTAVVHGSTDEERIPLVKELAALISNDGELKEQYSVANTSVAIEIYQIDKKQALIKMLDTVAEDRVKEKCGKDSTLEMKLEQNPARKKAMKELIMRHILAGMICFGDSQNDNAMLNFVAENGGTAVYAGDPVDELHPQVYITPVKGHRGIEAFLRNHMRSLMVENIRSRSYAERPAEIILQDIHDMGYESALQIAQEEAAERACGAIEKEFSLTRFGRHILRRMSRRPFIFIFGDKDGSFTFDSAEIDKLMKKLLEAVDRTTGSKFFLNTGMSCLRALSLFILRLDFDAGLVCDGGGAIFKPGQYQEPYNQYKIDESDREAFKDMAEQAATLAGIEVYRLEFNEKVSQLTVKIDYDESGEAKARFTPIMKSLVAKWCGTHGKRYRVSNTSVSIDIYEKGKEDAVMEIVRGHSANTGMPVGDILADCLAIGDGENDVLMLNLIADAGGTAVFVGKITPELKEQLSPKVLILTVKGVWAAAGFLKLYLRVFTRKIASYVTAVHIAGRTTFPSHFINYLARSSSLPGGGKGAFIGVYDEVAQRDIERLSRAPHAVILCAGKPDGGEPSCLQPIQLKEHGEILAVPVRIRYEGKRGIPVCYFDVSSFKSYDVRRAFSLAARPFIERLQDQVFTARNMNGLPEYIDVLELRGPGASMLGRFPPVYSGTVVSAIGSEAVGTPSVVRFSVNPPLELYDTLIPKYRNSITRPPARVIMKTDVRSLHNGRYMASLRSAGITSIQLKHVAAPGNPCEVNPRYGGGEFNLRKRLKIMKDEHDIEAIADIALPPYATSDKTVKTIRKACDHWKELGCSGIVLDLSGWQKESAYILKDVPGRLAGDLENYGMGPEIYKAVVLPADLLEKIKNKWRDSGFSVVERYEASEIMPYCAEPQTCYELYVKKGVPDAPSAIKYLKNLKDANQYTVAFPMGILFGHADESPEKYGESLGEPRFDITSDCGGIFGNPLPKDFERKWKESVETATESLGINTKNILSAA